eukprot:1157653-Pelagomonas_calceolata.AAC.6
MVYWSQPKLLSLGSYPASTCEMEQVVKLSCFHGMLTLTTTSPPSSCKHSSVFKNLPRPVHTRVHP